MTYEEIEAMVQEIAKKSAEGEQLTGAEESVKAYIMTAAGCHCGRREDTSLTESSEG